MTLKIPRPGPDYNQPDTTFAYEIIEQRLGDLERAIATGYVVDNPVVQRQLDVASAGLTDVVHVLGTLIKDLKTRGLLG